MFLASETPFNLGVQPRRPNQGYAVDNAKNNFTFYKPVYRLHTSSRKRSCTFPNIRKNLPIRHILLQDHFDGGETLVYSLEGKKITCETRKKSSGPTVNFCNQTLSM